MWRIADPRGAGALALALCLLFAGTAWGADPPAVVYGIETDLRGSRERVLVFASEEREARVEAGKGGRLTLIVPDAVLDPSAPKQVRPGPKSGVRELRAEEVRTAAAAEVRISILRRRAAPYELESRGSTLALSFARQQAPVDDGVTLAFENAELREIVKRVSKETGERFVFDEKLAGRATIVAVTPIARDSVLTLLHSVLHVSGFSAVPTPSGAHRIVPIADAAAYAGLVKSLPRGQGDAPLTLAAPLRSADATDVAARIGPYAGKQATVVAHTASNTLFVTGSESHVRTLLQLIEALDAGSSGEFWIRRTRYRDVEEIFSQVQATLSGRPGRESRARFSVDPSAQLLIVSAPPEELSELRELVAKLDTRPESSGSLHVYSPRYASPDTLAEVLNGIAQGTQSDVPARARALSGDAFRAVVDQGSGSLVVQADPETYRSIAELLDELDQPEPRIEVEVTLLEVVASDDLSLGFDAFAPAGAGNSVTGGAGFLNPSGGGLFEPGTGGGRDFAVRYTRAPIEVPVIGPAGVVNVLIPRESFVLTADSSFVATRVLQRPHLLILAGEEQEIFTGDNVPVPVAAEGAGNDPLTTRLNVERYDVGVALRVAASVGLGGRVKLDFNVETSRVGSRALVGAVDNGGPVIEERTLATSVWLDDDEPALLGGAEISTTTLEEVGTPWFKEIPMLGHLFKTRGNSGVKLHLVIAAQAHVHRDPSDDIAMTIRRRLGLDRALARRKGIDVGSEPGWGLRVTTRREREDAEAIAQHFAGAEDGTAHVTTWEGITGDYHDVLLTGFDNMGALSRAAAGARESGFTPEIIPLPGLKE